MVPGVKISIITPVGPGHQRYTQPADSICVDDTHGKLGRSKARNMGMEIAKDSDWFFFHDADDELVTDAHDIMLKAIADSPEAKAIFGSIGGWSSNGRKIPVDEHNRYPENWDDVVNGDTNGLFSISALYRAPEALQLGFKEDLDTTETLEFSMAFIAQHPWVKVRDVFSLAHCDRPSAGGPRGYGPIDWHAQLRPLLAWWRKRGRVPLTADVRHSKKEYWK